MEKSIRDIDREYSSENAVRVIRIIDNVKMWESLIEGNSVTYENGTIERGDLAMRIINALKDQGLEYKDGKIVSKEEIKRNNVGITPKSEFKVGDRIRFKGEDGVGNVILKIYGKGDCGEMYYMLSNGKEVPAWSPWELVEPKQEEMTHSIPPRSKSEFKKELEKILNPVIQSVWPDVYAEKCAKEWAENPPKGYNEELRKFCKAYLMATDGLAQESNQENSPILSNSSNTAKDELTEFEKYISRLLGHIVENPNKFAKLTIRGHAEKLLSIARKEIAEGIENDRIVMSNNRFADVPQEDRIRFDSYFYEEGIRDVVKKLKEG